MAQPVEQDGPMAQLLGTRKLHFVSWRAHAIGQPGERPVPPLNLVATSVAGVCCWLTAWSVVF